MIYLMYRASTPPLPLGQEAERSEVGEGGNVKKTCRCRHVKKICQWHIFSVDLSGYAAQPVKERQLSHNENWRSLTGCCFIAFAQNIPCYLQPDGI